METKMNKRAVEDIDETFLLNSIAEQGIIKETANSAVEVVSEEKNALTHEPQTEKPKEIKESIKRKRSTLNEDYRSRFLGRNEFKARQCVYISQRVHATISEIVNVSSNSDLTVGGYIDSILMEHLETNKEEITELYNRELEKKNSKKLMDF
jgi:hypothetical protein